MALVALAARARQEHPRTIGDRDAFEVVSPRIRASQRSLSWMDTNRLGSNPILLPKPAEKSNEKSTAARPKHTSDDIGH